VTLSFLTSSFVSTACNQNLNIFLKRQKTHIPHQIIKKNLLLVRLLKNVLIVEKFVINNGCSFKKQKNARVTLGIPIP